MFWHKTQYVVLLTDTVTVSQIFFYSVQQKININIKISNLEIFLIWNITDMPIKLITKIFYVGAFGFFLGGLDTQTNANPLVHLFALRQSYDHDRTKNQSCIQSSRCHAGPREFLADFAKFLINIGRKMHLCCSEINCYNVLFLHFWSNTAHESLSNFVIGVISASINWLFLSK